MKRFGFEVRPWDRGCILTFLGYGLWFIWQRNSLPLWSGLPGPVYQIGRLRMEVVTPLPPRTPEEQRKFDEELAQHIHITNPEVTVHLATNTGRKEEGKMETDILSSVSEEIKKQVDTLSREGWSMVEDSAALALLPPPTTETRNVKILVYSVALTKSA